MHSSVQRLNVFQVHFSVFFLLSCFSSLYADGNCCIPWITDLLTQILVIHRNRPKCRKKATVHTCVVHLEQYGANPMEYVLMMAGMRRQKQVSSESSVSKRTHFERSHNSVSQSLQSLKFTSQCFHYTRYSSLPISENTISLCFASSRIACYLAMFVRRLFARRIFSFELSGMRFMLQCRKPVVVCRYSNSPASIMLTEINQNLPFVKGDKTKHLFWFDFSSVQLVALAHLFTFFSKNNS